MTPPFIDAHVHLDAALTVGQPRPNVSGTLHIHSHVDVCDPSLTALLEVREEVQDICSL